jgi:molybdopterin-biosynthesis enzyme MoeA-like protein
MRDEVQKHGTAIQKANERKATVQEACKLFKNFLGAEARFIKSLEDNTRTCGVPPDAIKQAREGHTKASQVGKQVCDAAARGPKAGWL